jgi:hypothetical protein
MKHWRLMMWIGMAGLSACGEDHPSGPTALKDAGSDAQVASDASAADAGPVCEGGLSYAQLKASIFDMRCASGGCHTGAPCEGHCLPGGRGRVLFPEDGTRAYLVNVPSEVDPNIKLVVPSHPDDSLLVRKITNALPEDQSLGGPMPSGEAIQWQEIPQEEIAAIRCWIENGAP